jgi:hypothetical protein
MTKRRSLILASSFAAVVLLLAAGLVVRMRVPPYPTRLLPESDAIVFLNIAPIRDITHFDRDPAARSPDFQGLIDATGIVPERDLDSVAFALHAMPDPTGPNGPVAYSAILTLRYDSARLAGYLASVATAQESYAGHTLYDIPSDGRTVRLTLLDANTIAYSNGPTPEQIHAIIDHARLGVGWFSGPSILAARYAEVPWFSSAWAVGRIGLPFVESGRITALGLTLPVAADTEFVASLRFTTSLHLRIEQLAASEPEAQQSAQALASLLALVRTLEPLARRTPHQQALHDLTAAVHVEQHKDRAILTADMPLDLLKRLAQPN